MDAGANVVDFPNNSQVSSSKIYWNSGADGRQRAIVQSVHNKAKIERCANKLDLCGFELLLSHTCSIWQTQLAHP